MFGSALLTSLVAPSAPVPVLIVDNGDGATNELYLTRALSIGNAPVFQTEVIAALIRAAMEYYAQRGRAYLVAMTEPVYAPLLQQLGIVSHRPKQYAVFTFGREFSGIQLAQAAVVEYYRRHLIQLARDGSSARARASRRSRRASPSILHPGAPSRCC